MMADSTPISRDEFNNGRQDVRDNYLDLKADILKGFEGINDRLDLLNGKTSNHADRITALESKSGRFDVATLLSIVSVVFAGIAAWFAGKP